MSSWPGSTRGAGGRLAHIQDDDLAAWLQGHQGFEAGEPEAVTIGTATAEQWDDVVGPGIDYPECGSERCVPLFAGRGGIIFADAGWKERTMVVDVGGESLLVNISAPPEKFDALAAEAQEVLATLQFGS